MSIKKNKTGWQVDIQPNGRGGKRVRKTFTTKAEALAWERHVQAKSQQAPDWQPPKKDSRLLSELIEIWFKHHGAGLKDGEGRKRILLSMCEAMENPRADLFTPDQFAEYRMKRIAAGISPNTMNHEQAYLRAVFNETIRLGHWTKGNPLQKLRAFKIDERELSYLTDEQIINLFTHLEAAGNVHVRLVAKVCLATGARWGESESLRISQIRNQQIQFVQTKSSKARSVAITPELQNALHVHHETHGSGERLFTTAYSAFRSVVVRNKLKQSDGQLTHVLRHTFASHYVMAGGNILALQKVLGHHSLTMTMRYAHLSPDHMQETRRLNPVARLNLN